MGGEDLFPLVWQDEIPQNYHNVTHLENNSDSVAQYLLSSATVLNDGNYLFQECLYHSFIFQSATWNSKMT